MCESYRNVGPCGTLWVLQGTAKAGRYIVVGYFVVLPALWTSTPMLTIIVRRILIGIPTIFGILLLIFLILMVLPGNPAEMIQGEMANPAVTAALIDKWGLDAPPRERFQRWLGSLLRLDLGTSLVSGRPVAEMLNARLGFSAYLGVLGILFGLALGIPAGVLSALRPNSALDYGSTLGALVGLSLPVFVTALGLQLVFGFHLRWLPISGAAESVWGWNGFKHAILPAISIGVYQVAINARLVRTLMLEVLHLDFVRTARAKGASEWAVVMRHAFANNLIPLVTLLGVYVRSVIAGLLLVEIVFAWPGIGRLFFDAVNQRDYPVIQGVALVIALTVYLVNMLLDISYSFLDPRVRVDGSQ